MVKQLPNSYDLGKVRYIHLGFRVHKVIGKFDRPMEPVGKTHDSAEAALTALDKLGEGHAVFRIMRRSEGGEVTRERITKDDLPVHVVNYVGPPRNKRPRLT